jgi:hypothetical protein
MARLFEQVKTQLCVTTLAGAAAQTAITSSAVDTAGFAGVRFLVLIGTVATSAVTSIKLQQSDDDAASDAYSDILGSSQSIADSADNTHIYVDIFHPQKRYLKLVVTRGTADATIGGVIAELYGASSLPVTQVATGETHIFPAEGTA